MFNTAKASGRALAAAAFMAVAFMVLPSDYSFAQTNAVEPSEISLISRVVGLAGQVADLLARQIALLAGDAYDSAKYVQVEAASAADGVSSRLFSVSYIGDLTLLRNDLLEQIKRQSDRDSSSWSRSIRNLRRELEVDIAALGSGSSVGAADPTFTGLLSAEDGAFSGDLSVGGSFTVAGASTSTFTGGIDIATGCFAINGVCLGGAGSQGFSTTSADAWVATKSTSNLAEGSNLYYADARVASYITGSTTLASALNYWTKSGSDLAYTAGNIGIGTTNPGAGIGTVGLELAAGNGGNNGVLVRSSGPDNWFNGYLMAKSRGTPSAPTSALSGDGLGAIEWYGYDGATYRKSAHIFSHVDGTVSSGVMPGRITFATASTGGAVERMRITSVGNIGIGTTSPFASLSVHATSGVDSLAIGSSTATYFKVDKSGNVGIGVANPSASLHISNTVGGNIVIQRTGGVAGQYAIGVGGTNSLFFTDLAQGATRLVVNSSGNVGIGTTSPYAKLAVVGETVSTYFSATSTTATSTFSGGLSAASSLYVLQSGKVGIGTARPAENLSISASGSYSDIGMYSYSSTFWQSPFITSNRARGSVSSPATVQDGDELFNLVVRGYSSGAFRDSGSIMFLVDGTPSGSTVPGRMAFYLGGSDRMTILSGGNVGIGTTSPYAKLSVVGDVVAARFVATTTATSTLGGGVNIATGCYAVNGVCVSGGGSSPWTTSGSDIFYSGNVGIGVSNPAVQLHIEKTGDTALLVDTLSSGDPYLWISTNGQQDWTIGVDRSDSGKFKISAANDKSQTKMTVDTSGRVGIGTTSPFAALAVVGEVVASHFTATTTATSTFGGDILITGNIMPSADNTYSLGSATNMWKDVFIGPGSLYVNGKKVIEESAQTMVFSADTNQNVSVQTLGSGDIELNALGTGLIQLKSNVQLTAGKTFRTSDGSAIDFADGLAGGNLSIADNVITATNVNGGIEFSPNGLGASYFTTGNVGIGTTSPLSKLAVSGGVSVGSNYNIAAPADGLIVQGNVGIGTSSPSASLVVAGTAGVNPLVISSSTGEVMLKVGEDGNVGIGTDPSSSYKLSVGGTGNAYGLNSIGTYNRFTDGTRTIYLYTGGSGSYIGVSGDHPFSIRTNNTERVTATGSGNVGIGTTSPLSKLAVSGGASIGADYNIAAPTNGLSVQGNVGIGTNNPSSKLQMIGNFDASFGSDTTRIVGIGLDGSFSAGDTGIFRFADQYNQLETTYGSTMKGKSYNGWQFYNYAGEIARFGISSSNIDSYFSGKLGVGRTPAFVQFEVAGDARVYGGSIAAVTSSGFASMRMGSSPGMLEFAPGDGNGYNVSLFHGGTDILRTNDTLTVGGNLGVGTTTPYAKLSVWGASTGGSRAFEVVDGASTTNFVVTNNGMIGVNGANLGLSNTGTLNVRTEGGSANAITMYYGSNDNLFTQLGVSTNGFIVSPFQSGGNFLPITMDGLDFRVNAGLYGSNFEAFRVASTGNVGIGTTTPTAKLTVMSSGSAESSQVIVGNGTDNKVSLLAYDSSYGGLTMGGHFNGSNWIAGSAVASAVYNGPAGLAFMMDSGLTPGSSYTPTRRMLMNTNGNVTIGSTTADAALMVQSPAAGMSRAFAVKSYGGTDLLSLTDDSIGSGYHTLTLTGNTNGQAVGPLVVKNTAAGTIGTALTLDATEGGGKSFSFLSTGTTAGAGAGAFSVFNGTDNRYDWTMLPSGHINFARNYFTDLAQVYISPTGNGVVALSIAGASGQTANLLNISKTVNDGLAAYFDENGWFGSGSIGEPQAPIHLATSTINANGSQMLMISAAHDPSTVGSGGKIAFTGSSYGDPTASIRSYTWGDSLTGLAFDTGFDNPQTRMVIDNGGNVGIGTSSPAYDLHISDPTGYGQIGLASSQFNSSSIHFGYGSSYNGRIQFAPSTNTMSLSVGTSGAITFARDVSNELMRITASGNVGIGTTSPSARLAVTQSSNAAAGGMWIAESGNTDFRSAYMDTSGVLSFYGGDTAGTLNTATLNAAGEWTNASDISYKERIEDLSYGLDELMRLQPRAYYMKETDYKRIGFIAQEVELVIPELVSGRDGSKGISYGNITAVIVKAVQELSEKMDGVLGWFGGGKFTVQGDICVDDVCVTKEEFKDMLRNAGAVAGGSSDPEPGPAQETQTPDTRSPSTTPESSGTEPTNTSSEGTTGGNAPEDAAENAPAVSSGDDATGDPAVDVVGTDGSNEQDESIDIADGGPGEGSDGDSPEAPAE